ncbi:MAG: ribonuclease Y [Patescibacteria group bacterium]|jgi:ribonuclease Y
MWIENLLWLIIAAVGIPGGMVTGYYARKVWAARKIDSIESKLETAIAETKTKQKEILLGAQDKALKIVDDAKREDAERREELRHVQSRLEKRESIFDQKFVDLEKNQKRIVEKASHIDNIRKEIEGIKEQQMAKLERIAELTRDEAKRVLLENTERRMKDEILQRIKRIEEEGQEQMEVKAKNILALAMQRLASSVTAENSSSIVTIPSEDMKGRIIGKEGRNIKALENLTGVEIIIDETPDSIVISGFNAVRRQLAKRALEKLMSDGRIHPARIEESVDLARKELALEMRKAGEDAAFEVGVAGLDPKLLQILGRLKFRTSYGQNVLRHSIEVALLAGLLAEELKANVVECKKGGLLHDIGKAVDHEVQGTHMEIGYDILKRKFNMSEEIAYHTIAHHEDNVRTLEQAIVKTADAISGSRPGARKDTYEQYVQRLEELEGIAKGFPGVEKAFGIQAGRELRVFVTPEKVDDFKAMELARNIADQIQQDLNYPGEIKVTLIREKRVIEYAR